MACKNQKRLLKHQIVMKRGSAVDREISQKYANDKKMSTKEKEERALFRKNEVADSEATYLSIFFTNVLFLSIMIVMKRGSAVDREISQKYANDKKMSTKEKEERALFRKNEVADSEATYLSIFFTNVLFLSIMLFLAFFLLANLTPIFNSLLSVIGSAGLVAFLSTAKN
ncbi:Translocon-associated protein, gamma subunit [Cooperia oncophora]